MNLQQLKDSLPEYAKDIKLNISTLLEGNDTANLNQTQIAGIALVSAYTTKHNLIIAAIHNYASTLLSPAEIQAAKAAATIMAMNNVYYRFMHLVSDKSYEKMPAKLRMNIMANPGTEKINFELYSLAVSAINGCGLCMDKHAETLEKSGLRKEAIQLSIRIAAVINAAAQALAIEQAL